MYELIPFEFESKQVRVFLDENNEPWWVAKDVCGVLEHTDTNKAVATLDEDEKGKKKVRTPGGLQEMITISESGLYTLIMRSNKPQAKPFRKWVTSEVLPSIRKTGRYEREGFQAGVEIPILSRDFIAAKGIALATGLVRNDAVLAANKAVLNRHGIDCLDLMGVTIEPETCRQASRQKTMIDRDIARHNLLTQLETDIKRAAQNGCPFMRTSRTYGLYVRRNELTGELRRIARDKLERFAQSLLDQGHIKRRVPDGALI